MQLLAPVSILSFLAKAQGRLRPTLYRQVLASPLVGVRPCSGAFWLVLVCTSRPGLVLKCLLCGGIRGSVLTAAGLLCHGPDGGICPVSHDEEVEDKEEL